MSPSTTPSGDEALAEADVLAVWKAIEPARHTEEAWREGEFWSWYLAGAANPASCVHDSSVAQAVRVVQVLRSSSAPSRPEGVGREEAEDAAQAAYQYGYQDGYTDGRHPEGYDGDEREVHREIDSTSIADGWSNIRERVFLLLQSPQDGASQGDATAGGEAVADEAIRAIEFAVGVDDHYDRLSFLNGWLHGDLSEWPEFATPPETVASPGEREGA